jgi:2-iminobutanoate/2-iminopropanoate deaminase
MFTSDAKQIVHTDKAPKAIGPYSQAVCAGTMVFTAGQIGLQPDTGELVGGGIEAETRQVLTNLTHVLEACGSDFGLVLKTTVFLSDMSEFGKMNAVYAEFFAENPPARSTVAAAALPRAARVEIEAVALLRRPAG